MKQQINCKFSCHLNILNKKRLIKSLQNYEQKLIFSLLKSEKSKRTQNAPRV